MCQDNSRKVRLTEPKTVYKVVYFIRNGKPPVYLSVYRDFPYTIGKRLYAQNICFDNKPFSNEFGIGEGFLHFLTNYQEAEEFLASTIFRWRYVGVPGSIETKYWHKVTLTILECELDAGEEVYEGVYKHGGYHGLQEFASVCATNALIKGEFRIARADV